MSQPPKLVVETRTVSATHADLTGEQRKISIILARKLLSAAQIELPYVYVEKDGKRFYTLSAKRGGVEVGLVVTTEIPK